MSQITIAAIDDHYLLRTELCNLLEQMGFRVLFQTENGQIGLEKMEQTNPLPDVCILDVNMPVMNGFETAEALRRKYPALKILAYSMNNGEGNIIGMFQSGATGYITKGGDPEELKKAIETMHRNGCFFSIEVSKVILAYLRRDQKGSSGKRTCKYG